MAPMPGKPGLLRRLRFRADVWLAARLLPLRLVGRSFEQVLRAVPATSQPRYAGLTADYISRTVRRVTRRPLLMRDRRCLRQGLLGFGYMARAGLSPELHFGVERGSVATGKLAAHCWVCIDGQPVLSDRMPDMVTIYVHRL